MDCPPKSDIDTIFNRLRSQPFNKVIIEKILFLDYFASFMNFIKLPLGLF